MLLRSRDPRRLVGPERAIGQVASRVRRAVEDCALAGWDAVARALETRERTGRGVAASEGLRCAVAKQVTYMDLFTRVEGSPLQVVTSSRHRSGPVGLISDLRADCHVLAVDDAEECQAWREKREKESRHDWDARVREQLEVAVPADSVDWSRYDMVLAIENAIPSRVALAHPNTLFATMMEHHRMRAYRQALRRLPSGYLCLFNQRFGPTLATAFRPPHVVEWPYSLMRDGTIRRLLDPTETGEGAAVLVDGSQDDSVAAAARARYGSRVAISGGRSLREHLGLVAGARVFMAPRSWRPLWGNAGIEAAAADCVVVGRRADLWNPSMIAPCADTPSLEAAWRVTDRLLADEAFFAERLAEQRRRVRWYAFERPMRQLAALALASGDRFEGVAGRIWRRRS